METQKTKYRSLVDNLKDAGCQPETVILFLQLREDGNTGSQLSLLSQQRKKLLDEIHTEQAKLDCLDYLIYQIKKGQVV